MSASKERVLILNHRGVGELLMAFPAVRFLKKSHKGPIYMTVSGKFEYDLCEKQRCADYSIIFSLRKNLFKLIKDLYLLRKKKFDLIIAMFGFEYSMLKWFSILIGVKKIYYIKQDQKEVLKRGIVHKYQRNIDIVSKFINGNISSIEKLDYFFDGIMGLKPQNKVKGKYITFICGSGNDEKYKRWPIKQYVDLADKIVIKNSNISFAIVGSKNEFELGEKIRKNVKYAKVINFSGKLNLEETKVVCRDSLFVLGGDCGGLHFAKASKAKVVVITGPTNRDLTAPINTDISIDMCMKGRPWYNRDNCLKNKNLEIDESMNISYELVYDKINSLI